jgi:hypothetical protein
MSFQTLKKDILRQVAEDFAVELEEDATKAEIIAALSEDGVTWDMYKEAYPEVTELPDKEDDEDTVDGPKFAASVQTVLLKMERANGTYQVRGYRFTREHPYLPVKEDDANYILENIDGFKIASPREAQEYYS